MRERLDRIFEWAPTSSQPLFGLSVMFFGLLSHTGADIVILVSGREEPTQFIPIPQLVSPLPWIIVIVGLWLALVPTRVNMWLLDKVKRLMRGDELK